MGYPLIHVVSTTKEASVSAGGSFSTITPTFLLELKPSSETATLMVDLYLGYLWIDSSDATVYVQVEVTSDVGVAVAAAAELTQTDVLKRSVFVRGFLQVSTATVYTFTPQWKADKGTAYLQNPGSSATGLISHYLTVTEVSDDSSLVIGGANSIGNVAL